ncbi:MAG: PaaI family thioesterase [Burkholderiales bacterium]
MSNPFGKLIGLHIEQRRAGFSELSLEVAGEHLNPNHVVHGAVVFALADTGMGAALHPTLAEGELCATVEIKISYFKPVTAGRLVCTTEIVNRGKTLANLESRVFLDEVLVAQANGHYAIFRPRKPAA